MKVNQKTLVLGFAICMVVAGSVSALVPETSLRQNMGADKGISNQWLSDIDHGGLYLHDRVEVNESITTTPELKRLIGKHFI